MHFRRMFIVISAILSLAFASATQASTVVYDFTVYLAGIGAGGGFTGSLDYSNGAVTDLSWVNFGPWTVRSGRGDLLSFTNTEGDVLTTTLGGPLGGRTDTTSPFVISLAAGGGESWCGGSGFCNSPIVLTETHSIAHAPELGPASLSGALTLLGGGLLVLRARRLRVR
jgi:hypothetical protein